VEQSQGGQAVSLEMTVKIQWQKEQISLLKQHIRRLEEAGDKMEAWLRDERLDAVQHTVSKWNKAKEDKP
jgi:hypothetical protein